MPRFEADAATKQRVTALLRAHGERVADFWRRAVPDYIPGCTFGTTSFRPVEEKGRDLNPRSSNEFVHIDAGAYFSETDRRNAMMADEPCYPGATYVVTSVVNGRVDAMAAYRWDPARREFAAVEMSEEATR